MSDSTMKILRRNVGVSDNQGDDVEDPLTRWLNSQPQAGPQPPTQPRHGLRFAFYGRMSTGEHQDRVTSRHWQRDCASELVAAHGMIVAEYFDVGCSRRRGWRQRPRAAALLAALPDPRRGFDAIVVGEYERAFSANQLQHLAPVLEQHGVQLWLPETDGSVDHHDPTHRALIMMLGAQSKREVQRARFRVVTAMRAQARERGRYLGGRPPYGYRLVDAAPPSERHARPLGPPASAPRTGSGHSRTRAVDVRPTPGWP
ncbi:recombinase family protein [Micromonospora sp. NPDC006431]|uniref:recombinase family protein n=1 Tax=Micromonospora sp. NPDC006431 TaxID=3364235 RepID=UPI00368281DB